MMMIDENGVLHTELKTAFKENLSGGDNNDYVNVNCSKRKREKASSVISGVATKMKEDEDEKGVKAKEGEEESDKTRKSKGLKGALKSDGLKKCSEGYANIDLTLEETPDLEFLLYPDPEFNDFDKDRNAERFNAGQIWAAYDYHNVMPRFYALIKRVSSPGFNVHITWLEPKPSDMNELKWLSADLPFSCGEFKYGYSERTVNRFMFSHEVSWGKGSGGTFLIYPRMGETWALFKNWNIKWSSNPAVHRQSEYDYVEILYDYDGDVGVDVALLSKVNGFVSVFFRMDKVGRKTFHIPPGELLRFSHMIPSYKMEGNGRGFPNGSFELDPAALPLIDSMVEGDSDMQMMIDESDDLQSELGTDFSKERNIRRFSCHKQQVSYKKSLSRDDDGYVNVSPLKIEKAKTSNVMSDVASSMKDDEKGVKQKEGVPNRDNAKKSKELKEPVKMDGLKKGFEGNASIDSRLEEALRAMRVAEKKMQSKEFVVAQKIALKAQRLYPNVENISQLLMVCHVHCSAAQKLSGDEMDWYGILQLEETADEATIKKQYRKFVLQLHPDRNKLAGAEIAFKLIAEARSILLDKDQRLLHNVRRKYLKSRKPATFVPNHKANWTSNVVPNNSRSNLFGLNAQKQQPRETFWTVCPYCAVRYQFCKDVINKSFRCHSCQKSFLACDLNAPNSKSVFPTQKGSTHKGKAQVCPNFGTGNLNAELVHRARKSEEPKEPVNVDGLKKSSESSANTDSSLEEMSYEEFYKYCDPDFNDFEMERKAECFAVGQVWAAYDIFNAMPRFYAQIRRVSSPKFSVHLTWLEPEPADENESKWHYSGMPFSCGKFKYGESLTTDDCRMFCHIVSCEKGSRMNTFVIYPRKGETWALFKNWDFSWSCDPAAHRQCEYEYVEVLSDYAADVGIHVDVLSKVNGFVSIFCQMEMVGKKTFLVPPRELLRFSHMIPSYKMKGNEKGVPIGSFELDPAALPPIKPMTVDGSDLRMRHSVLQHDSSTIPSAPSLEQVEIPDTEFYNFDFDKAKHKFEVGQIWALYCVEDSLPKYYGQIKKIDFRPSFKLHIKWLASVSSSNIIRWSDKDMPVSCGRFKVVDVEAEVYDSVTSFSHPVKAELTGRRNEYDILPRKGEIWALYRNWNPNLHCSDLKNCEYEVVEVLSATVLLINALSLERVDGFTSVFKARVVGGSTLWSIPQADFFKFSHQVPAFRLTEERGGKLRGFFELDTAALPIHYFR
ncbi:hypothetical protein CsatA_025135 [Cannabis sativa]